MTTPATQCTLLVESTIYQYCVFAYIGIWNIDSFTIFRVTTCVGDHQSSRTALITQVFERMQLHICVVALLLTMSHASNIIYRGNKTLINFIFHLGVIYCRLTDVHFKEVGSDLVTFIIITHNYIVILYSYLIIN